MKTGQSSQTDPLYAWRARRDSNARPLPSEGGACSLSPSVQTRPRFARFNVNLLNNEVLVMRNRHTSRHEILLSRLTGSEYLKLSSHKVTH